MALGIEPLPVKIYDSVSIDCSISKYHGVIGEVFRVERLSRYAMIDMPKGTEMRAEGIGANTIVEQMRQSETTRKTPITRWPRGDPQWFPLEWLRITTLGHWSIHALREISA